MNEKEFNRNCDGTDYGNWVPLNMMKAMGGLTGMLALASSRSLGVSSCDSMFLSPKRPGLKTA